MKKYCCTALVSLLTIVSCVHLFVSPVKAATVSNAEISSYGSYFAETYFDLSNNNQAQGWTLVLPFVEVDINNSDSSTFHLHYDFKEHYEGYISVTVTTGLAYKLQNCEIYVEGGWFQSIPNKTTSSTSKTFQIGINGTDELDFYLLHRGGAATPVYLATTTYSITYALDWVMSESDVLDHVDTTLYNLYDYMAYDMDTTLHDILSAIGGSGSSMSYQLPLESLSAWLFVKADYGSIQPVQYSHNLVYPNLYCQVDHNCRTIRLEPDEEIVFYFEYGTDFNGHVNQNAWTYNCERLNQYKISGASFYKITIKNTSSTSSTGRLIFDDSGTCIPIYYGYSDNMPDYIREVFGIETKTNGILNNILNAINGLYDDNQNDINQYTSFLGSLNTMIQSITNVINSGLSYVQSDSNLAEQDLTAGSSNFYAYATILDMLYTGIDGVFPSFSTIVSISLMVVIIRSLLL